MCVMVTVTVMEARGGESKGTYAAVEVADEDDQHFAIGVVI